MVINCILMLNLMLRRRRNWPILRTLQFFFYTSKYLELGSHRFMFCL